MNGKLFNIKWNIAKEWLDEDLIHAIKKSTNVRNRNVGSIHKDLKEKGHPLIADEFEFQLETRVKGNYPPNTYFQTIKIGDKFLKVKLTGRKEEITFFKPILEDIQKKTLITWR